MPARRTYHEPLRPFLAEGEQAPLAEDRGPGGVLDIEDVLGRRGVETRLMGRLTIPEENSAAALEVMSRFAADPRCLVYLPPTMAPTATSERSGLLEHPAEAFAAYRREGVPAVGAVGRVGRGVDGWAGRTRPTAGIQRLVSRPRGPSRAGGPSGSTR